MTAITSFHEAYRFLSNCSPAPVLLDGITYPTVEHAHHAAKTTDPTWRRAIRQAASPAKAKRLGRTVPRRSDWHRIKVTVMTSLVRQKFTRSPELAARLLATHPCDLIEGNAWGDTFWGVSHGRGQNHLGRILMQIREELRHAHRPKESRHLP
jgi:ribA/ribD-fused uncharacterized protein